MKKYSCILYILFPYTIYSLTIRNWLVWHIKSVILLCFIKSKVSILSTVCDSQRIDLIIIPTGPDQLPLSEVKEATKELQSEWYGMAVELGICYSVKKVGMVTDHL